MNRMKNIWVIALSALVLVSALVAGCGQDSVTETTAGGAETTAGGTGSTVGSGDVITIQYGEMGPETGWLVTQSAKPWLAQIEEATSGRVKTEPYWAETLFKGVDAWEAIKAGVGDFGWCFHGMWAGMTSLSDVVTLPFMPIESSAEGSEILWTLYEEFPTLAEQYKDNKILTLWTSSPYYLLTTKKKVDSLEDFKGLKIRTVGGPPTDVMKAMGAVPVSMSMPDAYQALQTGVVDGILQNHEGLYSWRHYELVKYMTPVPVHVVYFSQAMNTATWDSMPADIQEQIMSVNGMAGSQFWAKTCYDDAVAQVDTVLKEQGYELEEVEVAEAELAMWTHEFGEPLWEAWVTKMEGEGHPEARDILKRCVELATTG